MDLFASILLKSSIFSLFFSVAVFIKKTSIIDLFEGVIILVIGFDLFNGYMVMNSDYYFIPEFFILFKTFCLLYGPLLYLYSGLLTKRICSIKKIHFLYIVPFLLYFLYSMRYVFLNNDEMAEYLQSFDAMHLYLFENDYFYLFIYIAIACCCFLAIYNIRSANKRHYSEGDKNYLDIFNICLVVFTLCHLCFICKTFYHYQFDMYLNTRFFYNAFFLCKGSLIFFVYLFLFKRADKHLFRKNDKTKKLNYQENTPEKEKYKNTKLNEKLSEKYLDRILTYIDESKIYKETQLTLNVFSERINISLHHVSQVINLKLNKNFQQFINSYRIEEAKKLLQDTISNRSILEIAYNVGFNSKTTFNIAFKRLAKQTPSEYRLAYKNPDLL